MSRSAHAGTIAGKTHSVPTPATPTALVPSNNSSFNRDRPPSGNNKQSVNDIHFSQVIFMTKLQDSKHCRKCTNAQKLDK